MNGRRTIPRWILVIVAASVVGLGARASANIVGSAHDFSSYGWSNGEICVPCHTPHNADTSVAQAPLWNHEVTTATYTVYSNAATLDATVGQPNGISKLCLSCHDGTVAVDAFGGAAGNTFISSIDPDADFGTDLSDDHPISFTYDTALANADGELFDPATTNSGLGGTIQDDMLFSDQLECASCHDVHNVAGNPYLLVKDNTASALCLTCHDK
ncbi:MAG: cytochrome C [Candidatus Dadabacteria bacterium]|nr:MAG: cytochrome C [Candidatus Dadabacteria bacterium]